MPDRQVERGAPWGEISPHPHAIDGNYRTQWGANDLDMLFMQSLSFPHLVALFKR
jgi:hypothetical protein